MTHDAIAALAALQARLQARLALLPEFRALKAIEASLREIETLGEGLNAEPAADGGAPAIEAREYPARAVTAPDPVAVARQDVNPMARALARGIEANVASMKVHRGVGV